MTLYDQIAGYAFAVFIITSFGMVIAAFELSQQNISPKAEAVVFWIGLAVQVLTFAVMVTCGHMDLT